MSEEKEICQAYYEYHVAESTLKEVSYTIIAKVDIPDGRLCFSSGSRKR